MIDYPPYYKTIRKSVVYSKRGLLPALKPHYFDMSRSYPQHLRQCVLHQGYTSYYENRGSARPAKSQARCLCCNWPLLLATALLGGDGGVDIVIDVVAVVVAVALMLGGRNPEPRLAVERLVLVGEINAITTASGITATLRQGARALRELGGDGGVLGDPIGEGVLAVLDDATSCKLNVHID